jgi:hypothetical protein
MEQQSNRSHRPAKEKKKYEGNNPKAFAFSKTGKLNRQAARSHDVCSYDFANGMRKLMIIASIGQGEETSCASGGSHA